MELFIGNLPDSITADELKRFFDGYGTCSGFLIVNKLVSGRVAHCAYGIIEPEQEGRRAIRELNHRELKGRPVMVMEHVIRERRKRRTPWGPRERRQHKERPWLAQPLVTDDRREGERRHDERRARERRVADRRSPTQATFPHPLGETRFNEHRLAQRRVAERRQGERRRTERRNDD